MASERIGDMTKEELRSLINQMLDERSVVALPRQASSRSVKDILESIDRHRIILPPGAKSNVELLREDRDR